MLGSTNGSESLVVHTIKQGMHPSHNLRVDIRGPHLILPFGVNGVMLQCHLKGVVSHYGLVVPGTGKTLRAVSIDSPIVAAMKLKPQCWIPLPPTMHGPLSPWASIILHMNHAHARNKAGKPTSREQRFRLVQFLSLRHLHSLRVVLLYFIFPTSQ
jgi:hypothetical protein